MTAPQQPALILRARCNVPVFSQQFRLGLCIGGVAAMLLGGSGIISSAAAQEDDGFALSLEEFLGQPQPEVAEDPMVGQEQPSGGIGSEAGDDAGAGLFDDAFGTTPTAATSAVPQDAAAEDDAPEEYPEDDLDTNQDAAINIFGEPASDTAAEQTPDDDEIILDFTPENRPDLKVDPSTTVTLRGLDKITARISEHKVQVGQPYKFGTLEIMLRTCTKAPPEETPEVTAFLEITEQREADEAKDLFKGWMYASNPAISALEHPVYDVWVIDCNIVSGLEE